MAGAKRGEGRSSKLRKGRWSKVELARLRDLWGRRPDRVIARELQRSVENVRKTAAALFRNLPRRTGPWTAAEVQRLRESVGVAPAEVVAQALGRTADDVRRQLEAMAEVQRTGRWTREEQHELKRLYGRRSDEDLARVFGRPPESIRRQAARLCLAKDKAFLKALNGAGATRMPRWTEEELDRLRELYPDHSNLDIATELNRSVKSVVSKAHHLGLRKHPERLKEMGRQNVGLRYGKP